MPDRIEDVAILIDGRRWRAWESVEITRSLDSFATVGFEAPFEPERAQFRSTFQPFSFKPIELRIGAELVFSGNMVGVDPSVEADARTVGVTAYARPTLLNDITVPPSSFPLEMNGLTIAQIAERLLEPFDIEVEIAADVGAVFRRVAMKPDEAIHAFLMGLAQQRNLVMTDTPSGALRFTRAAASGAPVVQLREGEAPLISVTPSFSPQEYFSEITGIARSRAGRLGARYTLQNTFLSNPRRPLTFELEDTDDSDLPTAVRAKMGRMFGNVLAVSIELPTWRDPSGALWTPNTFVTVEAPGAMIYRATDFLVREVKLAQTGESISASLELALPGAFSGEIPSALPWEASPVEILQTPIGSGSSPPANQKSGF